MVKKEVTRDDELRDSEEMRRLNEIKKGVTGKNEKMLRRVCEKDS